MHDLTEAQLSRLAPDVDLSMGLLGTAQLGGVGDPDWQGRVALIPPQPPLLPKRLGEGGGYALCQDTREKGGSLPSPNLGRGAGGEGLKGNLCTT